MTLILFLKRVCIYIIKKKNGRKHLDGVLMDVWLSPPNLIQQHNYSYNQKNILKTTLKCPLKPHLW